MPLRSATGVALIAATVLASMAGFLDASVVNVAVPAIARDLGTSLVALQWTVTGYLLTAAALLLVAGALADRYGRRRVLVAGLAVMLVASVAGIYVQDSRTAGPSFAPPAPFHGCARPDPRPGVAAGRAPVTATTRRSETS